MQSTFTEQLDHIKKLTKANADSTRYLVPLSSNDIEFFSSSLDSTISKGLTQVESPFSILLCNGSFYYKFSHSSSVCLTLERLLYLELLS